MLVFSQFWALCVRRFKNVCRKPFIPAVQVTMPCLFTWFIVVLVELKKFQGHPPLLLSLSPFGRSTVVYGVADSHNATAALAVAVAKLYRRQVDSDPLNVEYLNEMPGHTTGDNVHDYLMEKGKRDAHEYSYRTFVAAEFRSVGKHMFVTAFFNFQAYHTSAISLTLVDNALLKHYVGHDYSIETTNHPRQVSGVPDKASSIAILTKGLLVVMGIVIILPVTISSYTLFAVSERSRGIKDAQFISGLHVPVYWAAMFVCDNVMYVASAILVVCLFFVYDTVAFTSAEAFPATVLIFLLYGWASQPMMYVASFIFQSSGSALSWVTIFNLVSGKCGTIAYLRPVD